MGEYLEIIPRMKPIRHIACTLLLLAFFSCEAQTNATPDTPTTQNNMQEETQDTTVQGIAEALKAGLLVHTDKGQNYIIRGMDFWPEGTIGKRVEVTGSITREKVISKAETDENGAMTQGGARDWVTEVITLKEWKLLE